MKKAVDSSKDKHSVDSSKDHRSEGLTVTKTVPGTRLLLITTTTVRALKRGW